MDFLGLSAVCFLKATRGCRFVFADNKKLPAVGREFLPRGNEVCVFYFSVPQAGVSQEELHGLLGRRLLLMAST